MTACAGVADVKPSIIGKKKAMPPKKGVSGRAQTSCWVVGGGSGTRGPPAAAPRLRPAPCLPFQLGAKKGLGAQKVSSKSFSEVEKQAHVAEKLREEQAAEAKKQAEESM